MSDSETSREDRQLEASERRIQQAREDGQVPRSRELMHLGAALAMLTVIASLGPWLAHQALDLVGSGLRFDREIAFEPAALAPRLSLFGLHGLALIVPVACIAAIFMTGASLAIGGWNFTTKAIGFKFERLNPMAGLGRMVGWRHLLENLRLLCVVAAMLALSALYVWQHAGEIAQLSRVSLVSGITAGFGWLQAGIAMLAAVCFASALADVPMQIFKNRSELRMTRDEARQENKESDGDPHMKGERRRRARQLSRRMLADVPEASVIITNPTHYAVALRYDEGKGGAPRIVAMGTDLLALKIREIGKASNVPVLEAPPLARALYRHGDIGRDVPVELYTAVAQVLAWVFRLRTAMSPGAMPDIVVPQGLDPQEAV
ncbi:MAG: EscU/YscU/HrcU family type III secretion system export apparatus switch protein [Ramlibacter sp.]|nr:EscU/YscU/HrcU family type III secretion system export apparatus switch protein [Ramlibacter sp.]